MSRVQIITSYGFGVCHKMVHYLVDEGLLKTFESENVNYYVLASEFKENYSFV